MQASNLGTGRGIYTRLILGGVEVSGVEWLEVGTSNHLTAGWFRVVLVLGRDARFSAADFSAMVNVTAEVRVGVALNGLPPAAAVWQSLITGPVDDLVIHMDEGTVELCGRDLSALLIDTLTAETFSNQTASEIVQTIAVRHGFTPAVTATTTPVGRYYQDGHSLSSLYRSSSLVTEWDLLCALAQAEGYDLLIDNQNLVFAPPLADTAPTVWRWQPGGGLASTMLSLRMERSLALASDIVVTVQSWNSRQKTMISQTVRSSANGVAAVRPPGPTGKATTYVLLRPNLTPQAALNLATETLKDLSRHQKVVTARMPGDLTLAPRSLVALQGTGTDFDQTYVVDEIVRRVSLQEGFVQVVRAVNTPFVP